MPDSVESRLMRLEQAEARLEERVLQHETDIRSLAPLIAQMAVLNSDLRHLQEGVSASYKRIDELAKAFEEDRRRRDKDREEEAERREDKRSETNWKRIGLLAGACGVLLSNTVAILVTVLH